MSLYGFPMTFLGMRIIESPALPFPKLQISSSCPMTDAFRLEMNRWLLDMFGSVDALILNKENTIVMSNEAFRKIKAIKLQQIHFQEALKQEIRYGAIQLTPRFDYQVGP